MKTYNSSTTLIEHLWVCITFFYVPERLSYLQQVINGYEQIANKITISIITNITNYDHITSKLTFSKLNNLTYNFISTQTIGHNYLYPWLYTIAFNQALKSSDATHFLYTEDDHLFTRKNVIYWLEYRDSLAEHGFIPSFFRVEYHKKRGWVSTDQANKMSYFRIKLLKLKSGEKFIGFRNPYQGLFFLDRPLMEEFSTSGAINPDFGIWHIREKAAQGLTFVNVPKGYKSRNLVLLDDLFKGVSDKAWVHHLPNNYACDDNAIFGKLNVNNGKLFTKFGIFKIKIS